LTGEIGSRAYFGGLVDERALLHALRQGWIAGAGLDVLAVEPPRGGNPLLDVDLPNLIVTPHVAWASREAMQGFAEQLVGNLEAFVAGAPRSRVACGALRTGNKEHRIVDQSAAGCLNNMTVVSARQPPQCASVTVTVNESP
jgi:hypothetical protein